MNQLVSVIIPTRNRTALVSRAIQSVLNQTYKNIEAVVVIDGPDAETEAALKVFTQSNVTVLALAENVGGSEARNIGVRAAKGEWIAMLDDDDEWMTDKIEKQMAVAVTLPVERVVVTCRYIDRMGDVDFVRPRGFPVPGQRISDFLYSGVSILGAMEGFPQTSTWLVSRKFFLEVPFRKGLKRNQDTDWLLQALRLPGVSLAMVPEVLSIFYNERKRTRITQHHAWEDCRNWAVENRELFTPQALSSYLAIMPMNLAAQSDAGSKVKWSIIQDCRRYGALNVKIISLLALYGYIYPLLRRTMTPALRKKALYYASALRPSRHAPRTSGKGGTGEVSSVA